MELSPTQMIEAVIAAVLVGFSKTGIMGLGVVIVPLMADVFPAKASVGALLPMLVFADIFAVVWYRRHARWSILLRLLPWVLPGIALGYVALRGMSSETLRLLLGALVFVMVALKLAKAEAGERFDSEIPHRWWFSAVVGILSGFATMVGNIAGALMGIYLLSMGLKKHEFIGTGAWYYLIVNVLNIPLSASLGLITAQSLRFNVMMVPAIALGAFLGKLVLKRIPQRAFGGAIVVLAAVAAIRLLLT